MFIEFDKKLEGHVLHAKSEEINDKCFICDTNLEVPFLLCERLKLGLHINCEERSKCRGNLKNDHQHIKIVKVLK